MEIGAGIRPDLAALVAGLADNKYFLGRRYAEWCTAAPTLESAVAAAAMAQDEVGHARSLYPLLKDMLGDSPEAEPETRTAFAAIPALQQPFDGWVDFVAANFLFDTAMSVLLEAAQDSSLKPLAQRARRILEEEPLHWLHGEGWVRRLPSRGHSVRDALDGAVQSLAPETLGWLDIASDELISAGTLREQGTGLRQALRLRVNPVLVGAGLTEL